ncbi:uncharacterized protein E6C27_scaffold133G001630 [Cucumis melo var. makuwa]|uniref:Uncharacterized protein n=1 Tax=Cucumis melo var. makuwa TaxID=1194695 RepID=A0A5A7U364_CUCMM|nr:uncharacterized protein E6C27_scaffold133G001630 [Cucumis melo var. makuwa]
MATLAAAAVRQARALARVSSPQSTANLIHKRGLAGAADHHGPPKVNCWQDPMSPSKWKEEHFVLVSLSGWGLLIFGGYKFFTRGKGNKDELWVSFELFTISTSVNNLFIPFIFEEGMAPLKF